MSSTIEQLIPSADYPYIRARQLEGTFPGDPMTGVWPVSIQRVLFGWGNVPESDWPHGSRKEGWPPPVRLSLDRKARSLRTHCYQRVRSVGECCRLVGLGKPVSIAVEITKQWFESKDGLIELPRSSDEIVGSHSVSLVGLDLATRLFTFLNSWGAHWGAGGRGVFPFRYVEDHLVSSWVFYSAPPHAESDGSTAVRPKAWSLPDPLGDELIWCAEVHDGASDERMGWTILVRRGMFLDIEELFVRPAYRRQGVATELVDRILELALGRVLPLRAWIPFADWSESNLPALRKVLEKLGLGLFQTREKWAAAVALNPPSLPRLPRKHPPVLDWLSELTPIAPGSTDPGKVFPAKPAATPPGGAGTAGTAPFRPLRGTSIEYRDPTKPVAESDWESLQ